MTKKYLLELPEDIYIQIQHKVIDKKISIKEYITNLINNDLSIDMLMEN